MTDLFGEPTARFIKTKPTMSKKLGKQVYACDCTTGGEGFFKVTNTEVCPTCTHYCILIEERKFNKFDEKTATPEFYIKIQDSYHSGISRLQITRDYGISYTTVNKILKMTGDLNPKS